MTAPCWGCRDRRVGCHGQCARYGVWKGIKDQERDVRELERLGQAYEDQQVMEKRSALHRARVDGRKRRMKCGS